MIGHAISSVKVYREREYPVSASDDLYDLELLNLTCNLGDGPDILKPMDEACFPSPPQQAEALVRDPELYRNSSEIFPADCS